MKEPTGEAVVNGDAIDRADALAVPGAADPADPAASGTVAPAPRDLLPALRRLWTHLAPRRRTQAASLLLLTVVAALAEVTAIATALPFLVALTTPDQLLGHPMLGPWLTAAGLTGPAEVRMASSAAFAAAALASGVLRIALNRFTYAWTFAVGADLDGAMFRRTMHQPYAVQIARHSSELIAGVTTRSDVLVYQVLAPCLTIVNASLMMAIVLAALICWRPLAALGAFGGFVAVYGVVAVLSRRLLLVNSEIVARASTRVVRLLQEGLGGIRDVLIDGTQSHYARQFVEESRRLRAAQGAMHFLSVSPRFGVEALGMALIAGVAWAMSRNGVGLDGALTTIGALAFSAQRVLPMLQETYGSYSSLSGAYPTLLEGLALLDQPEPGDEAAGQVEPLPFRSSIRLEQVGFRYGPTAPWVLRDVSLDIPRGARIGIVGTSGCGKSTLLDLIVGLQAPGTGRLIVDGVALDDTNRPRWRAHIAQVPQSIHLADCSVEENIAFGVPK
jgi:ATP-binding cassette subfamily B protein